MPASNLKMHCVLTFFAILFNDQLTCLRHCARGSTLPIPCAEGVHAHCLIPLFSIFVAEHSFPIKCEVLPALLLWCPTIMKNYVQIFSEALNWELIFKISPVLHLLKIASAFRSLVQTFFWKWNDYFDLFSLIFVKMKHPLFRSS